MKALLFFLLFGLSTPIWSQLLQIDFSGTDLSQWQGDRGKFSVVNGQLQLSDPDPGSSNEAYLSLLAPTAAAATTTWEVWVQLDFAPSAGNYTIVYLNASAPDLRAALNGYYLRIGGISGDQDAVELFRQDGNTSTLLISATAGAAGTDPVLARIRVSRSANGLWQLASDYSGGNNFQEEGSASDDTYPMGRYFGFRCLYSSTRANAFAFDDIRVEPLFTDETPPVLLTATPIDQNTLSLQFDEPLDAGAAAITGNYTLSGGLGNPESAARDPEDPSRVRLDWAQNFVSPTTYTISASGIVDESGNTADGQQLEFSYLEVSAPEPGDLLITELMADPSPPRALPNAEYIELFNPGAKVLTLKDVGISTGGNPRLLPDYQVLPGEYLILCDEDDTATFETFGPTLGIAGFPALTNGGDEISLTDAGGQVLVELTYDLDWYQDDNKTDGGWSLELIRTDRALNCPGNWIASQNNGGGTPGQVNSVNGQALETNGPVLISAYAENDLEVLLRFDEALDPATAASIDAYRISGGLQISEVFLQPGEREVLLILDGPLQAGTIYEVSTGNTLTDCLGNPVIDPLSRRVGLSQTAVPDDLVINEILFFPEVGGEDFIELYNRSNKTINLRDWFVNNRQADGSDRSESIDQDFLIFPGEYVVLTEAPQDILDRYTVNFPERLLANKLPTMADEGQLTIRNAAFILVDSFAYSADLHSPLLSEERGVSLERVDAEAPTNSPGNWHSAAGALGFATPTAENSQYLPARPATGNVISLAQKRFSPDGDGFEDLLLLQVEADRPGYLASIQVFDANGRLIRRLLRNELLPVNGLYKWDGTHADGHKARIGIYVIWVELVHPDGTVERWQETCVLAGNLED